MKPLRTTLALCAAASTVLVGGVAAGGPATGSPTGAGDSKASACGPRTGVPVDDVSIQLYTFAEYVGGGTDAATLRRLREVLAELADIGYRNVEPYSFYGMTPQRFARVLKSYGLRALSRHGDADPAGWADDLRASHRLGQRFTGSGGLPGPGIGSYADVLASAATMNRLGAASAERGTGPFAFHNHQDVFTTSYTDPFTGEETTAWELLVRHTDPRHVTFQLDAGWAIAAGVDVPALLREHRGRVALMHVKDGVPLENDLEQRPLGTGEVDVRRILAAAKRTGVELYVFEQDPVFGGEVDTMLDEARVSFDYLDCVPF